MLHYCGRTITLERQWKGLGTLDTYHRLYLLAVACLFVFSPYRVEDGDNVRWTVRKIGRAGHWRLVNVHGIRVLKDGEAAHNRHTQSKMSVTSVSCYMGWF